MGQSFEPVYTTRNYYKDGKKIYSKRGADRCVSNLLKHSVKDGKAACPQCGNIADVSSYVNGCDYCGTAYKVKDFEPKVSTWILQEREHMRIWDSWKGWLLVFAFFWAVMFVVSVIIGWDTLWNGVKNPAELINKWGSVTVAKYAISMPSVSIIAPFVGAIVLGIVMLYYIMKTKMTTRVEWIIQDVIPEFSAEEFVQEFEFKLKNLYMAREEREVLGYTNRDVAEFFKSYQDVIDCNVEAEFKHIKDCGTYYEMTVKALARLYMLDKDKVKVKREKLELIFTGDKEMVANITQKTISKHTCSCCGGSIDIYSGAECPNCRTTYDYSKHGWMIASCKSEGVYKSYYRQAVIALIVAFVLVNIITPIAFVKSHETEIRSMFGKYYESSIDGEK